MLASADRGARSLAEVRPDERVRVQLILYGILRDLCDGAGLHEGDCVTCRRSSGAHLVLESEHRRRIVIDQEWARFISVRHDPDCSVTKRA